MNEENLRRKKEERMKKRAKHLMQNKNKNKRKQKIKPLKLEKD